MGPASKVWRALLVLSVLLVQSIRSLECPVYGRSRMQLKYDILEEEEYKQQKEKKKGGKAWIQFGEKGQYPIYQQVQENQAYQGNINQADATTPQAEEESKQIIVWKLVAPRHARKLRAARLQNGQRVPEDTFEFSTAEMREDNRTSWDTNTVSFDVTGMNIQDQEWYTICVTVNMVFEGRPAECEHCEVVRAKENNFITSEETFLDVRIMKDMTTATSVTAEVNVRDIPFTEAYATVSAVAVSDNPRCSPSNRKPDVSRTEPIYADTATVSKLEGLYPERKYRIQIDIHARIKEDGGPGDQITLMNYMREFFTEEVSHCD